MPELHVFLGVVSYSGTRFPTSQGPEGLGALLTNALRDRDVATELVINTQDMNPDELPITVDQGATQRSLTAELRAESRYSAFIARPDRVKNTLRIGARWAQRLRHVVDKPATTRITRLLNIEASHLDLLRKGIESNAKWIVIVEDDAVATDCADLAQGLAHLFASDPVPAFINLSESFSLTQLGVTHLLTANTENVWEGTHSRTVFTADRPITNTVCAIAYSRKFVQKLLPELESMPVDPVLSIDWKLNVALMNLYEQDADPQRSLACWWVEPAPITQMSMHS